MVKSKYLIVLSAAMLLAACGAKNGGSSSSTDNKTSGNAESTSSLTFESSIDTSKGDDASSEEPIIDGVTFDQFLSVITWAASIEATSSSGGTYKSIDTRGNLKDTVEYSLDVFNDNSSYATGSVKQTSSTSDNVTQDEFIERKAMKFSQVKDAGVVYDDRLLYTAKDYKNDCMASNSYRDSSSRIFVSDKELEGVDESSYISVLQAKWEMTMQATDKIISFFDANFYSSAYASQLGINSVHEDVTENSVVYTVSSEYQLDGDLNDTITYKQSLEVTMDSKKSKVLSFKTYLSEDDVSKMNPNDRYFSAMEVEATVLYDEKVAAPEGTPDVEDYFLHSVDKVKLLDSSRNECDPLAVSPSSGFLYITPDVYSPSTTIGVNEWTITPEASSDDTIVTVGGKTSSNPYFEVKGTGTVELTYSYFGRNAEGVYETRMGTLTVKIRDIDYPTSISVTYLHEVETDEIIYGWSEKKLAVGRNYKVLYSVRGVEGAYQNKAPQDVVVTSSNESVLTHYFKDGNLYFQPLAEGTATMKIQSVDFPDIYWECEYTVFDGTGVDLATLLVSSSWHYEFPAYGTDYTMKFNKDGTGDFIDVGTSKTYEETFKWVLDGETIKTSNWSYNYGFEDGTFNAGLESISFYVEEQIKSYVFNIVK